VKQLGSLVWKEWHETRAFLWIGLAVLAGLPMVAGLEAMAQYHHQFEISASPWVTIFGGVLAIFVAAGATCRDLGDHLENFWRSRPIGAARLMLVKYFVGLAVVLIACDLPLVLEVQFNRDKNAVVLIAWMPFLWIALYSLGFLAGCLVRSTAHAAMLGLAAMLLVYFLPVVLPPLQWMNVTTITDDVTFGTWPDIWTRGNLAFAVGMLGLAVMAVAAALMAVRRGWRIESGRKMMYGSVAAAVLFLFASAAFQLGTNLPILQQIDLPQQEQVVRMRCDGQRGFLLTWLPGPDQYVNGRAETTVQYRYRSVEVTASGIKLGGPLQASNVLYFWWAFDLPQAPGHPEIAYGPAVVNDGLKPQECRLDIYAQNSGKAVVNSVQLWQQSDREREFARAFIWQGKLYVIGAHAVTLDITEALKPRIISDQLLPPDNNNPWAFDGSDRVVLSLPPVTGLPARQRLDALVDNPWRPLWRMDGDDLCAMYATRFEQQLLAYRLTKLTDTAATFQKIGVHEPTLLEIFFGQSYYQEMRIRDGLVYMANGFHNNSQTINPSVSVFDTRGPHPLRMVGHFAAPGALEVCPLPDGRALVGGSKLWLVGPPPRRGEN
jgi:hypothetical protein